jgi:multiple sugar transport system ATP-binding protein
VSSVELIGITRSYGDRVVLDAVDLTVREGERVAVLGPSGSGKTTLLRVIAGLEAPDAGAVRLDSIDVTDRAPRVRDVALVTQDGSLQPHLDVRGNLSFALRIRHVGREEIDERVDAEARAFSLRGVLNRRPRTLSAGMRHEVALARSLVRRASVLLVDEPFARMDPPRRAELLRELIAVQSGYGVTLLVATNDQRVASGVADRLVVLEAGRVAQTGSPDELYRRPATTFVAGFLGEQPMNLLQGDLRRGDGPTRLVVGALECPSWDLTLTSHPAQPVTVGIRPADVHLGRDGRQLSVPGTVIAREFLGYAVSIRANTDVGELSAVVERPGPVVGDRVVLTLPTRDLHVFDAAGRALAHGI